MPARNSASQNLDTTVIGIQGRPINNIAPNPGQALVWSGTAWAPATPVGIPLPVSILMGGTGATDAPTALDNLGALPIAGGTMTGDLILDGDATDPLGAVTLEQLDGMLDDYLPLAGGTLTGELNVQAQVNVIGAAIALSNSSGPATTWNVQSTTSGGFSLSGDLYNFILREDANPIWLWSGIGGAVMTCDTGGNLGIIGTLTQGSDAANKSNIAEYTPGLDVVSQLMPKTFTFNSDEEQMEHLGFIAQDVQPVLPDAVSERGDIGLGLDTTAILAVVVNAVKELLVRLEAVEAKV